MAFITSLSQYIVFGNVDCNTIPYIELNLTWIITSNWSYSEFLRTKELGFSVDIWLVVFGRALKNARLFHI